MIKHLRSVVFGLLLALASPLAAFAQCSGQAPASTYCGNPTGALALPGWKAISGLPFPSIAGGTVVGNRGTTSATATAITNPILGIPGTSTGQLGLAGATSGTVTILPQAAAGTYNFNLPTGAGTSGQPLLSGGGGASPMTFGTLAVPAGGTGLTSGTSGGIPYFSSTSTIASSALLAANQIVIGGGAGTTPATLGSLGSTTTVLHGNAGGAPTFGAVVLTTDVSGILPEANGGTNQSTYTLGNILYASATNTLSKLAGNTTTAKQYLSQTGNGAISAAPAWATIDGGDITGAALTRVDDTNVTLTLGGTPTTSLLRATSLTLGWTGTLAYSRGGCNAATQVACRDNIFPTPTRAGDIPYWNGSAWTSLAGNNSGTKVLQEDSSGVPSFASFVKTVTKQKFTASGTYTPTTGMLFAEVEMVGGGAGGGGCAGTVGSIYSGGGGSSGSYSRSILTAATVGASKTVTVGGGGNGGTAGANTGSVGSASCLTTTSCVSGQIVVANGGAGGVGGSGGSAPVGGAPAAAGTGDLAAAGTAGLYGSNVAGSLANFNPSGGGGSSYFGGGAQGVNNAGTLTGANAGAYGSGGSGGNCYNTAGTAAGGNGSAGVVFITEYLSQ